MYMFTIVHLYSVQEHILWAYSAQSYSVHVYSCTVYMCTVVQFTCIQLYSCTVYMCTVYGAFSGREYCPIKGNIPGEFWPRSLQPRHYNVTETGVHGKLYTVNCTL